MFYRKQSFAFSFVLVNPSIFIRLFVGCLIFSVAMFYGNTSCVFAADNAKEGTYAVKVGDTVITMIEFNKAVSKLHTSNRLGKVISESGMATAAPDYKAFLQELIDDRLMFIEAKRLGLDKNKGFLDEVDTYSLNLYLETLRRDEINNKVKVGDEELFEYILSEFKKNIEKKRLEDSAAAEKLEKDLAGIKFEKIPPQMVEDYRGQLKEIYRKKREIEYFDSLRNNAKIKIYKKALESLTFSDISTLSVALARVNGKDVTGMDIVGLYGKKVIGMKDEEKASALDKVILYRLIDEAALNAGYSKLPENIEKINEFYEKNLVKEFKKKVVAPLVNITEEELKAYYDKNKENFRSSDLLSIRAIYVPDKKSADSVMKELKKGGNFGFIAGAVSLDEVSKKKGGDMGWMEANSAPADLLKDVKKAKKKDILGPYKLDVGLYLIVEYRDRKEGTYATFESKKEYIDTVLGKERYNQVLKTYIARLHEGIKVEVNPTIFGN